MSYCLWHNKQLTKIADIRQTKIYGPPNDVVFVLFFANAHFLSVFFRFDKSYWQK